MCKWEAEPWEWEAVRFPLFLCLWVSLCNSSRRCWGGCCSDQSLAQGHNVAPFQGLPFASWCTGTAPLGRSLRPAASQQPGRKSTLYQKIIRGPEKSALVGFLVCTFHTICCGMCMYIPHAIWAAGCDDLEGSPVEGLSRATHSAALLSPFLLVFSCTQRLHGRGTV